jgi:hypothetical protein
MQLPTHTTYHPDIEERAVHRLAYGGPQVTPASPRKPRGGHSKMRESPPVDPMDDSARLNLGADPESEFGAE